MSVQRERSIKVAVITFLAFMLTYFITDAVAYFLKDYVYYLNRYRESDLEDIFARIRVSEVLYGAFAYLMIKTVYGYYLLLFLYLYFTKFSLDQLRGWQVLWMSIFNGVLILFTLIGMVFFASILLFLTGDLGISNFLSEVTSFFKDMTDIADKLMWVAMSGFIAPIVLWVSLCGIRRFRAT